MLRENPVRLAEIPRATPTDGRIGSYGILAANVLELRRGPPETRKLPQSIQSPEGVDLILSRDGRIRTGDPLNPIQVRYRAAPRPVREGI